MVVGKRALGERVVEQALDVAACPLQVVQASCHLGSVRVAGQRRVEGRNDVRPVACLVADRLVEASLEAPLVLSTGLTEGGWSGRTLVIRGDFCRGAPHDDVADDLGQLTVVRRDARLP
jgi:hypothetical protein